MPFSNVAVDIPDCEVLNIVVRHSAGINAVWSLSVCAPAIECVTSACCCRSRNNRIIFNQTSGVFAAQFTTIAVPGKGVRVNLPLSIEYLMFAGHCAEVGQNVAIGIFRPSNKLIMFAFRFGFRSHYCFAVINSC